MLEDSSKMLDHLKRHLKTIAFITSITTLVERTSIELVHSYHSPQPIIAVGVNAFFKLNPVVTYKYMHSL